MNLAKIYANGQITMTVEIRWLLGLKSGDKILFFQKQDGEVVISNASTQAIHKAQAAFAGAAEAMIVSKIWLYILGKFYTLSIVQYKRICFAINYCIY